MNIKFLREKKPQTSISINRHHKYVAEANVFAAILQIGYRKRSKLQRWLLHPATGEHKLLVRIRYGAT